MNDEIGSTPIKPKNFVVGIGASAGGLEALEQMFSKMPIDTGMSFVVVQHLSPDFESVMDELLIRKTKIPVQMVTDGMEVEPNAIYLIPPKKEMIISDGRLLLTDKDPNKGLSLPIDQFFRSLADECGERAIAVVLSGTGSDGSRGICDIRNNNGLVIVQSEDSAKFNGMPKSALETGAVDMILSPAEIGQTLARYMNNPIRSELIASEKQVEINEPSLKKLLRILRESHGIDFSVYKQSTVLRRIERRLIMTESVDLEHYVELAGSRMEELEALYGDLLIGVTQFFRDPNAFDMLKGTILPKLLQRANESAEFRVWIAGCATGEEAYSIAILIDELFPTSIRNRVKIFATDVHKESLAFASNGIYRAANATNLSQERLDRYFVKTGDTIQVSKELRQMIVFAQQNVIKDAPFTKLDLVCCRNMLIYFQPAIQRKVISLFHFGLKTKGVLFLGPSENIGELEEEFRPIDRQWKFFSKRRDVRLKTEFKFLNGGMSGLSQPVISRSEPSFASNHDLSLVYDELLDKHLPPSVLINEKRQILHVFGDAGRYLHIGKGRSTGDVLDLFQDNLKTAITGAIQRVVKDGKATTYTGVRIDADTTERQIKVSVSPIFDRQSELSHLLISFAEIEPSLYVPPEPMVDESVMDVNEFSRARILALEEELRHSKENLQATIEELEASNEELQTTNEELIASNEEMQSTNEELHSVNEELYTVNAEYQRKISELTEMTDDEQHLLSSTNVGVLFLDNQLAIRKFTPEIARQFNFNERDIGRPFDQFTHNIRHEKLLEDVRSTIESGESFEKDVKDRSGCDFLLRILPYRIRGQIEGVVLTLVNVASLKEAEKRIRKKDAELRAVLENSPSFIFIKDTAGVYLVSNAQSQRVFGASAVDIIGKTNYQILSTSVADRIAANDEHVVKTGEKIETEEVIPLGNKKRIYLAVKFPMRDEDGNIYAIAGIKTDITRIKSAQNKAKRAIRVRDKFMAMLSHELRNPLAAIQNAAGVLQRMHDNNSHLNQVSDVITRQGTQLARILDDLLDISRVVQGKIELRKSTVDLRSATEDALHSIRSLATTKQIRIHCEMSDGPLLVFGDAARLQQTIANLLVNAVKYTPPHGEVHIELRQQEENVTLEIRDNGVGMTTSLQRRIFEPFVQGTVSRDFAQGGMGVGLTLVKKLIEMHQGEVTAASDGPNKGSTFCIHIPVSKEPLQAKSPKETASEKSVPKLKIVVVEDEKDIRDMMQILLEMDGHNVIIVNDGEQAVHAIKREAPDLAFLDIGLPKMDGYAVMKRLCDEGLDTMTFCIALTGFGQQRDVKKSIKAGFRHHITKPVSAIDLNEALQLAARFQEQRQTLDS